MSYEAVLQKLSNYHNFDSWKRLILTHLVEKGLFDAIDHHNDLFAAVHPIIDRRALSIIILSCEDDPLANILGCNTALEAWGHLHNLYSQG